MPQGQRVDLAELQTALDETHRYLDRIHLKAGTGPSWDRLINMIHALDHLQRIHERCEEEEGRAKTVQGTVELTAENGQLIGSIPEMITLVQANRWQAATKLARKTSKQIHRNVEPYRSLAIDQIATGQIDVLTGTERLEAIRWLRRVSQHIRRITEHMSRAILAIGQ